MTESNRRFLLERQAACPQAECAIKTKSPRFCRRLRKLRAADCPRYMNVPSPAPCHVAVAGVGKQSVWGLRIIARSQLSLWHHSTNSSIANAGIEKRCVMLVLAAVFATCTTCTIDLVIDK